MSVSATSPPSSAPGAGPTNAPVVDAACPLCGAPLHQTQDWCLNCGAAARTRLAAPTNWKAPIAVIAVIAALALGVLAASLVKLDDGSSTTKAPSPVTTTITATTPLLPGAVPTTAGTTSAAGTTGASGATGSGAITAPTGAATPGTPTTLSTGSTATGAQTQSGTPSSTPSSTPTATTPSVPANAEEALRKAGFLPRSKK
jgi:hypothetical protein